MKDDKKADWLTMIPFMFCVICIMISLGKLFQSDNEVRAIDVLDSINSNIFSTYISMVICMLYQFFTANGKVKQERSGLSKRWISRTIILTVLYGIIAIINACRYGLVTTLLTTGYSICYVYIFLKYMRIKRK